VSNSKLKSTGLTALKISLSVGLIAWIVQRGGLDPNALKVALEPKAFLVLGALAFLQILFANARWQVLLRGQGFSISTKQTLPLTLIGMFFNYAMPGSVGGDIVKGFYLAQDFPEQKLTAGVSVFMDRLIGLFVMVFSGAVAILAFYDRLTHDPRLMAIGTGALALTAIFVIILAVSLSRRLQSPLRFLTKYFHKVPGHKALHEIYHAMHSYRTRVRQLSMAVIFSIINQFLLIVFFYFAAQLLGETNIPLSVFWFCIPIGLVATSAPITPAGVGVGQAVFLFLFQTTLGHPSQVGTVGITLLQVFQFLFGIVGAFFYLRRGAARRVVIGPTKALADVSAD
jgi:uncharacterized protein (TIRG00374 family)